ARLVGLASIKVNHHILDHGCSATMAKRHAVEDSSDARSNCRTKGMRLRMPPSLTNVNIRLMPLDGNHLADWSPKEQQLRSVRAIRTGGTRERVRLLIYSARDHSCRR